MDAQPTVSAGGTENGHTRYIVAPEGQGMDTDAETVAEGDETRRRFVAWYEEWYLRIYAALAVVIVAAAGYGYATGALSWWNAGGMVAALAALSGFIAWRVRVDPGFEGE